MPRPVITLTTDFGPSSAYVAQMKGVVLGILDDARLIDVCHSVPPQQILAGGVILHDAFRHFPTGSIHVAVVDPGVGSRRKIVLAEIAGHYFVAPDNGLLSIVAGPSSATRVVYVERPEFWHHPVSPTFHGRDIMAPVAAHLARGVAFGRFGPAANGLQPASVPAAGVSAAGATLHVIQVDTFGNLVTNLQGDQLPPNCRAATIRVAEKQSLTASISKTYADAPEGQPVILVGSSGRVELAVVNGNAAQVFDATLGTAIDARWEESTSPFEGNGVAE